MVAASELARARENLAAENFARARRICERILAADPDSAEALAILGTAEMKRLRFREAAICFARAVEIAPDHFENWDKLGYCHLRLRLPEKALVAYRSALKASPPSFESLVGAAHVLTGVGKIEEAKTLLTKAVTLYPRQPEGWRMLAALTDFKTEPKVLAALEARRGEILDLPANDQAELHFALAMAYEALGQKDKFREAVETANALQRTIVLPWRGAVDLLAEASNKTFTSELAEKRTSIKAKTLTPIFIASLPRSGSTLIEQMLAAHPEVFGGDELPFVRALFVDTWPALTGSPYPLRLATVPEPGLDELARKYQERAAEISGGRKFITDKNVENILYLGIIRMAMPWAKVVYVRRHPADLALSIYKRYLLPGVGYACDLKGIGHYLKTVENLVRHWETFAPDFIHAVKYEDFVRNPERTAKGILKFCGLDWDPRVLEFQKAARMVYTPSAPQVRRPLTDAAIGRWKEHRDLLQSFLAEAGALVEAYGD